MKRTKKIKKQSTGDIRESPFFEEIAKGNVPDLILCADLHLREDTPLCRTDDFEAAQWSKMNEIKQLQKKYDCLVIAAGDIFHHWKPSPYLLSKAMVYLPKKFYVVYGQHDLPQHSLELMQKSGINTLRQAGFLSVIEKGSWGQEPGKLGIANHRKIGVWHKFVWDGKNIPWPGCEGITAKEVLKKYPEYDLIVTGDHHKPFMEEYKGRILVNPGCLTRQASNYDTYKPLVWFYYSETNTVVPHYLKASKGVVSRDHIERRKEEDKRLDSFIERLSDDWEVGLSFEENLERFLTTNKVRTSVKELIYKALDHEKNEI